jgi:Holliday junction resolvase RusA-like endonuclease
VISKLKIPRNLPPSMNDKRSGYGSNHFAANRTKKQWEGLLFAAILQAKPPKPLPGPVEATAVLIVPTRRRRDEGNFRMVLEKSLGDVLQKMGYIPDDTPEFFTFAGLEFEYQKGMRETRVTLTIREPDAGGTD